MELHLEVTKTTLDTLCKVYLAKKIMIDVCDKMTSGDITSYLSEDNEISNGVKDAQLLIWVMLFLVDKNLLVRLHRKVNLIRHPKLSLLCPNRSHLLDNNLIFILLDDGLDEFDGFIPFHEVDKRYDHINYRHFVVDVE